LHEGAAHKRNVIDGAWTTAIAGLLLNLSLPAQAQTPAPAAPWPSKAVRIIVPIAPGGGADLQARLFGRKFNELLGQPVIVENRPGVGGHVGAEVAAKSPADGYTLLFATASIAVNASLQKKSSTFDPVRDLEVVSLVSSAPLVLSVHPSMPVKTVPEFVALARKRGGDLTGASNGAGTTSHLAQEMLQQVSGLKLIHVPYKGGVPATTALVGGEVDFSFTTVLTVQPFIKQGKVRGLAVTTPRRSSSLPDLPTMNTYFKDFDIDNWYAFFVPTGTPKAVIVRLHEEIVKSLKSPEVIDYLVRDGGDPLGTTPEAGAAHFRREVAKYAKLVAAGNVQPN
jgi:tripartite-type tricarboxylate transporter receptor subunit TctC